MAFILPGILLIGLILIAMWWICFGAVLRQERAVREARRREADFEKWLATPNEPLYCVACQQAFRGPLEIEGCPGCHIRAFVIPVRASNDKRVAEAANKLPPIVTGDAGEGESTGDMMVRTPENAAPVTEILPQGTKNV